MVHFVHTSSATDDIPRGGISGGGKSFKPKSLEGSIVELTPPISMIGPSQASLVWGA